MSKLPLHIVLVEPEIAPNTGNAIRLCANVGAQLHLVGPMGFPLDSARMRRAGLDYHEIALPQAHTSWDAFVETHRPEPQQCWALSSKADADFFAAPVGSTTTWLFFGPETRGLSASQLAWFPPGHRLRLPMQPGNRSLNLSNAVAVCAYDVWRRWGFAPGA